MPSRNYSRVTRLGKLFPFTINLTESPRLHSRFEDVPARTVVACRYDIRPEEYRKIREGGADGAKLFVPLGFNGYFYIYIRLQRNEKTSLSGYEISFPEWLHLRLYFRRCYPGLSTGEFSRRHVSYLRQPVRDPAGFESTLGRTPTYYNRLESDPGKTSIRKNIQKYITAYIPPRKIGTLSNTNSHTSNGSV